MHHDEVVTPTEGKDDQEVLKYKFSDLCEPEKNILPLIERNKL